MSSLSTISTCTSIADNEIYAASFRKIDPALLKQHKQLDIGLVLTNLAKLNNVFYIKALLNSEAIGSVINKHVVESMGLATILLLIPIRLKNDNGTLNANGAVRKPLIFYQILFFITQETSFHI